MKVIFDCNKKFKSKWDEFVINHPKSNLFFLSKYADVVRATFGHKDIYVCIMEEDEIKAVIPLFLINSFLFGNILISLPYVDYGGGLLDENLIELERLISNLMRKVVRKYHVNYLELRSEYKMDFLKMNFDTTKVNVVLPLPPDEETLWKSFPAKVRNQVRKAHRSGLIFVYGRMELVDDFYDIFAHNMRDLGSPVYPKKFFLNFIAIFKNSEVFIVKKGDKPIGAAIATYYKEYMEVPWASSLRKYFKFCPNNLLYWEAMRRGITKGKKIFRFGRSTKDSGPYKFKMQWGGIEIPLYYYNNSDEIPTDVKLSSDNTKFKIAIKLWKNLPIPLTKILGPIITKHIP